MTIDKSLRVKRGATRNRSVLTRVERIARLQGSGSPGQKAIRRSGLPKVRVRKLTMKKKKKKKEEEEGAAAGRCCGRRTGCQGCGCEAGGQGSWQEVVAVGAILR